MNTSLPPYRGWSPVGDGGAEVVDGGAVVGEVVGAVVDSGSPQLLIKRLPAIAITRIVNNNLFICFLFLLDRFLE